MKLHWYRLMRTKSSYEILEALKSAKNPEEYRDILTDIPPDHAFWFEASLVFRSDLQWAYKLKWNDPDTYSTTPVNPAVFKKILNVL